MRLDINAKTELPVFYSALLQTRSHRILREHVNESIAEFDVSVAEWAILGIVNEKKKVRLADLAHALDVEAPLVTNLIDLLIDKSLVKKVSDHVDRRVKFITLTTAGKKLIPKIDKKVKRKMAVVLSGLSDADLRSYFKVLDRIAFPQ